MDHTKHDGHLFAFNKLLNDMHMSAELTIEGARKLGHYLLIFMWRFIFKSPMLFRVKSEFIDEIKILERFCVERHDQLSKQLFMDKLFYNDKIELFDDVAQGGMAYMWVTSGQQVNDGSSDQFNHDHDQSADNDIQRGEKRMKPNGNETKGKRYSLINYFETITSKYVAGDLQELGCSEINKSMTGQNSFPCSIDVDTLVDLVLRFFDYTPSVLPVEDQDVKLYFIGLSALLDYLSAEILELGVNVCRDNQVEFVNSSSLQMAVALDEELTRTIFLHMNLIPLVDMNCFYGSNQEAEMPPMRSSEQDDGLQSWSSIPSELHSIILRHFSSLEDVLKMRLVCKQWNYFIMNDNNIWKSLIRNTMVEESLFKYCDSSFTVEEMESTLARGKSIQPLYLPQQVINYYLDVNDWKSLYFIIVRQHLTYLRDLGLMKSRELLKDYLSKSYYTRTDQYAFESSYLSSLDHLQIGITKSLDIYPNFTKSNKTEQHSTKTILIPKEKMTDFTNLNKDMYLVTVIDFSDYSYFLSARILPKSGLLYCFHDFNHANSDQFLYYENYSMNSLDSLVPFHINEKSFKLLDLQVNSNHAKIQVNHEQIVVNMSLSSQLFHLQQISAVSHSCLAPCYKFNDNHSEQDKPLDMVVYNKDRIVLYSCAFEYSDDMNERMEEIFNTVAISISGKDLIDKNFNNVTMDWCENIYY